MGEIEHAGTAKAMPAITSDDAPQVAGEIAGEIIDEPTTEPTTEPATEPTTEPAPAEQRRTDKIARERGMPPISRR